MIERYDDWLLVKGASVAPASKPSGRYILGEGVMDFTVASIEAFREGHDVGFARSSAKGHGLRLVEEGAHRHLAGAVRASRSLNMEEMVRVGVDAIRSMQRATPIGPSAGPIAGAEIDALLKQVKAGVLVHSGAFRLSGGGTATAYVDTIPAVTAFTTLQAVARLAEVLVGKASLLVAPPFGGISLGIFLGMHWAVDVAIPLRGDLPCRGLVATMNHLSRDARVLLVDDYFSTGSTASRILSGSRKPIEVFAVCKTAAHQGTLDAKALLMNNGGVLECSEEFSGIRSSHDTIR